MENSSAITSASAAPDTLVISATLPVPGLGQLAANAFVIRAAEPVLVDAGVVAMAEAFFDAFARAIDLSDLRHIWLTHTDADHTGCLQRLLDAAPRARVVTNFLGLGKLGLSRPLAPDRVYLINEGQTLDVGDRRLRALRPLAYDAPETQGLLDEKSGVLFSADCFGAVLPERFASARDIPAETLAAGLATWGQIDAPWLSHVKDEHHARGVQALERLRPTHVLSSHLPPAPGMEKTLIAALERCRRASPFVGPDQAAMVRMALGA